MYVWVCSINWVVCILYCVEIIIYTPYSVRCTLYLMQLYALHCTTYTIRFTLYDELTLPPTISWTIGVDKSSQNIHYIVYDIYYTVYYLYYVIYYGVITGVIYIAIDIYMSSGLAICRPRVSMCGAWIYTAWSAYVRCLDLDYKIYTYTCGA